MSRLPYQDVRIIEKSSTLTGRLVGLLFADQGAEVFVDRSRGAPGEHDVYLDRGKIAVPHAALTDTSSADVIIVDGNAPVERASHQILLRVTAAVPGDEAYGHLAADCSEDLLNALVGIFTDMAAFGRVLERPVIYTPLPICSVYAGVHGAIAAGAALADRERHGNGRDIVVSRLAGGLSAIGALTLTSSGTPEHLGPARLGGLPSGLTLERFQEMARDAARNPARQLWLAQRFSPLSSPFRAADGRLVLPMVSPNKRLIERLLKALGVWEAVLAAGMVSESCYDPGATKFAGRNLAGSLDFANTSTLADLVEKAFARKAAAEWERELCGAGVPCVAIQSWDEWKQDPAAHQASIFTDVRGSDAPQIGRSAWIASAQPYPALETCRHVDALPAPPAAPRAATQSSKRTGPLEGFTVVDLCNVVAGPACGRVFVELGATVIKIDPMRPQHVPPIMVTFAAETAVGKRSLILDTDTVEGRTILHRIVAGADLILANKLDGQFARMGLDPASLKKLNPRAIGVQLSAHRGREAWAAPRLPRIRPGAAGAHRHHDAVRRRRMPGVPWHRLVCRLSVRISGRVGGSFRARRPRATEGRNGRLGRELACRRRDAGAAAAATHAGAAVRPRQRCHRPDRRRAHLPGLGRMGVRTSGPRCVGGVGADDGRCRPRPPCVTGHRRDADPDAA